MMKSLTKRCLFTGRLVVLIRTLNSERERSDSVRVHITSPSVSFSLFVSLLDVNERVSVISAEGSEV